jgi:hypothetical protein
MKISCSSTLPNPLLEIPVTERLTVSETEMKQRGYDDTTYLTEMAEGMVTRRFASVEDAAKTVLDETGGSNVDRLRRKFREQGWYERGLESYVQAEIARRREDATPELVSVSKPIENLESKPLGRWFFEKFGGVRVLAGGFVAFVGVTLTVQSGLAQSGLAKASEVTMSLAIYTFLGLCVLAGYAGHKARGWGITVHLVVLFAMQHWAVRTLSTAFPDDFFSFRSAPGSLAFSMGMTVMGVYVFSAVEAWSKRAGKQKSPEFAALSLAIMLISLFGVFNFGKDVALYNKMVEKGVITAAAQASKSASKTDGVGNVAETNPR